MDERNFTFMVYGFSAAWVILAIYILTLVSREKRIHRQLENLRHMLEDKEKK